MQLSLAVISSKIAAKGASDSWSHGLLLRKTIGNLPKKEKESLK